jgi:hypothetical protein
MTQKAIEQLKAKKLCYHCVGEDYLSTEIKAKGKRLKCSYCNKTTKVYRIGDIAERIDTAFSQHYTRTSDQPNDWQYSLLCDKELDYEWERDGEPVVYAIMNAAYIPETAAEDIQRILEDQYYDFDTVAMGDETEFSTDSYYEEIGASDHAWQEEWHWFEKILKTKARFFSRPATEHLASVFRGIEHIRTQDGRPLIINVGPGTPLEAVYRARVFQSDDKLKIAIGRPDLHLGPPPALLACAGRMNAPGISVFYGTNDPNVAIAEVRPPVGSQVAIARFEIVRSLRLLDLTALSIASSKGSIFDPQLASRLEHALFLRSLSQRITKPVMPDDEVFDYLPTQAIADFLATEAEVPLDGIIFPSVQAAGNALNIVLFHKAARVEMLSIPHGTEISARTGQMGEEGWEVEYSVIEEVPPPVKPPEEKAKRSYRLNFSAFIAAEEQEVEDYDDRKVSLRIVLDSVRVHIVRRVQFDTEDHRVWRHRWEKIKLDF